MANIKISELSSAAALVGSEVLPIVQSNQTVKVSAQDIAKLSGVAENITYASLYSKIVNAQLVPGQWYRLTDYKSVNFLNGLAFASSNPVSTNPAFNPRQVHVSDPEVLLLQATSTYEISKVGYSESYTSDIIQYEAYTNKIGVNVNIFNGQTLPDSSTVSGFDLQWDGTNVYFNMPTGYPLLFGHYLYLYCEFDGGNYAQDGVYEPVTPGDCNSNSPYTDSFNYLKPMSRIRVENGGSKVVLIDLVEADYTNYVPDSLYIETVYALADAYGWITRRQDTFNSIDVCLDFRNIKYRRFEVDFSSLNPSLGTGYYGLGDNYRGQGTTGNYRDYAVLPAGSSGFYMPNNGGPDVEYNRGCGDNCVFLFGSYNSEITVFAQNITVGRSFTFNKFMNMFESTIGGFVINNICTGIFSNNLIAAGFSNNVISEFTTNNIADSCSYNEIRRLVQVKANSNFKYNRISELINTTIGDNFIGNIIQASNNTNNTIGNFFTNNTITRSFAFNTIGDEFTTNLVGGMNSCTVGVSFKQNIFPTVDLSTVNFSSSTHVYGDYTCNISKRSNGSTILSYIDPTNVVQYVSITA